MVQAPTALGTCSSEGEGLTGSDVGSGGRGFPLHHWSVDICPCGQLTRLRKTYFLWTSFSFCPLKSF